MTRSVHPHSRLRRWTLAAALVAAACATPAQAEETAPRFVPTAGWVAPQPGEHPRLLFRKADIPALRQRANTEQGKQIIARLKVLLGGGEAMPTLFSHDPPVNSVDEKAVASHPVGTFTLSHPVGFGMLYVLTGEKKYADLARECLDKVLAGQVDRDSRYNFATPGTGFRLGYVLQSICLSYDLCADAWPPEYKKQIVDAVMNMKAKKVDKDQYYSLEELAKAGGYPPGSNHFGAYLLGPGLTALTFKGEPGADDKRLSAIQASVEANLVKLLGEGFGDHGWFAEGTACARISANTGTVPLLQSLKIAGGKDYISPRPDGRYTVLRLIEEIVPVGGQPQMPARGDYGDDRLYNRPIITHMGDFAEGMGAVLPREAQAMAWIYDHFVEPADKADKAGGRKFNAEMYPHLAVYAFVNWPEKSLDPNEVLPKAFADDKHGYYVARNGWKDADDVIVTTLMKRGPGGYKSGKVRAGTIVWGFGEKLNFGGLSGKTAYYRSAKDGSIELADEKGNALVADYSGASGAPALIAAMGDMKAKAGKKSAVTTLTLGDAKVTVLTLSPSAQPTPASNGNLITIGKQTLKLDAGHLVLGTFDQSNK